MTFRVNCPNCDTQAIVGDSREVSKGIAGAFVKDLYCHCANSDCCAAFVVTAAFSRYLNPPRQTAVEMMAGMLSKLPAEDRQMLLNFSSKPH